MIVLQIRGVRDSLRFRWSEWVASLILVGWGGTVAYPVTSLGPNWSFLLSIAPEGVWGIGAFVLGVVRIGVLGWNGRWTRCHQARWVLSIASCFLWGSLVYALSKASGLSTGLAPYAGLLIMDFGIVYISAYDAKRLEEARANGVV